MMTRVPPSIATKQTSRTFFDALSSLYDLSSLHILSPFTGFADLTLVELLPHVDADKLECWIYTDEQMLDLPKMVTHFHKGDAYDLLKEAKKFRQVFQMIDIDTPQGLHKDAQDNWVPEHFRFLRECLPLLDNQALVILYVNLSPYDKTQVEDGRGYPDFQYEHWMYERRKFYGSTHITHETALSAYRSLLNLERFDIQNVLMMPCLQDVENRSSYAVRMALHVVRRPA